MFTTKKNDKRISTDVNLHIKSDKISMDHKQSNNNLKIKGHSSTLKTTSTKVYEKKSTASTTKSVIKTTSSTQEQEDKNITKSDTTILSKRITSGEYEKTVKFQDQQIVGNSLHYQQTESHSLEYHRALRHYMQQSPDSQKREFAYLPEEIRQQVEFQQEQIHQQQQQIFQLQQQLKEQQQPEQQQQSDKRHKRGRSKSESAQGRSSRSPSFSMKTLKRRLSASDVRKEEKEKKDKKKHSESDRSGDEEDGSLKRRSKSMDVSKKFFGKSPIFKRKKHNSFDISDAELVFSTYSGSPEPLNTLQRKKKDLKNIVEKTDETDNLQNNIDVKEKNLQNEKQNENNIEETISDPVIHTELASEDLQALRDLLLSFTDVDDSYLHINHGFIISNGSTPHLRTPHTTPQECPSPDHLAPWQRIGSEQNGGTNHGNYHKLNTKELREKLRQSGLIDDTLVKKLQAIENHCKEHDTVSMASMDENLPRKPNLQTEYYSTENISVTNVSEQHAGNEDYEDKLLDDNGNIIDFASYKQSGDTKPLGNGEKLKPVLAKDVHITTDESQPGGKRVVKAKEMQRNSILTEEVIQDSEFEIKFPKETQRNSILTEKVIQDSEFEIKFPKEIQRNSILRENVIQDTEFEIQFPNDENEDQTEVYFTAKNIIQQLNSLSKDDDVPLAAETNKENAGPNTFQTSKLSEVKATTTNTSVEQVDSVGSMRLESVQFSQPEMLNMENTLSDLARQNNNEYRSESMSEGYEIINTPLSNGNQDNVFGYKELINNTGMNTESTKQRVKEVSVGKLDVPVDESGRPDSLLLEMDDFTTNSVLGIGPTEDKVIKTVEPKGNNRVVENQNTAKVTNAKENQELDMNGNLPPAKFPVVVDLHPRNVHVADNITLQVTSGKCKVLNGKSTVETTDTKQTKETPALAVAETVNPKTKLHDKKYYGITVTEPVYHVPTTIDPQNNDTTSESVEENVIDTSTLQSVKSVRMKFEVSSNTEESTHGQIGSHDQEGTYEQDQQFSPMEVVSFDELHDDVSNPKTIVEEIQQITNVNDVQEVPDDDISLLEHALSHESLTIEINALSTIEGEEYVYETQNEHDVPETIDSHDKEGTSEQDQQFSPIEVVSFDELHDDVSNPKTIIEEIQQITNVNDVQEVPDDDISMLEHALSHESLTIEINALSTIEGEEYVYETQNEHDIPETNKKHFVVSVENKTSIKDVKIEGFQTISLTIQRDTIELSAENEITDETDIIAHGSDTPKKPLVEYTGETDDYVIINMNNSQSSENQSQSTTECVEDEKSVIEHEQESQPLEEVIITEASEISVESVPTESPNEIISEMKPLIRSPDKKTTEPSRRISVTDLLVRYETEEEQQQQQKQDGGQQQIERNYPQYSLFGECLAEKIIHQAYLVIKRTSSSFILKPRIGGLSFDYDIPTNARETSSSFFQEPKDSSIAEAPIEKPNVRKLSKSSIEPPESPVLLEQDTITEVNTTQAIESNVIISFCQKEVESETVVSMSDVKYVDSDEGKTRRDNESEQPISKEIIEQSSEPRQLKPNKMKNKHDVSKNDIVVDTVPVLESVCVDVEASPVMTNDINIPQEALTYNRTGEPIEEQKGTGGTNQDEYTSACHELNKTTIADEITDRDMRIRKLLLQEDEDEVGITDVIDQTNEEHDISPEAKSDIQEEIITATQTKTVEQEPTDQPNKEHNIILEEKDKIQEAVVTPIQTESVQKEPTDQRYEKHDISQEEKSDIQEEIIRAESVQKEPTDQTNEKPKISQKDKGDIQEDIISPTQTETVEQEPMSAISYLETDEISQQITDQEPVPVNKQEYLPDQITTIQHDLCTDSKEQFIEELKAETFSNRTEETEEEEEIEKIKDTIVVERSNVVVQENPHELTNKYLNESEKKDKVETVLKKELQGEETVQIKETTKPKVVTRPKVTTTSKTELNEKGNEETNIDIDALMVKRNLLLQKLNLKESTVASISDRQRPDGDQAATANSIDGLVGEDYTSACYEYNQTGVEEDVSKRDVLIRRLLLRMAKSKSLDQESESESNGAAGATKETTDGATSTDEESNEPEDHEASNAYDYVNPQAKRMSELQLAMLKRCRSLDIISEREGSPEDYESPVKQEEGIYVQPTTKPTSTKPMAGAVRVLPQVKMNPPVPAPKLKPKPLPRPGKGNQHVDGEPQEKISPKPSPRPRPTLQKHTTVADSADKQDDNITPMNVELVESELDFEWMETDDLSADTVLHQQESQEQGKKFSMPYKSKNIIITEDGLMREVSEDSLDDDTKIPNVEFRPKSLIQHDSITKEEIVDEQCEMDFGYIQEPTNNIQTKQRSNIQKHTTVEDSADKQDDNITPMNVELVESELDFEWMETDDLSADTALHQQKSQEQGKKFSMPYKSKNIIITEDGLMREVSEDSLDDDTKIPNVEFRPKSLIQHDSITKEEIVDEQCEMNFGYIQEPTNNIQTKQRSNSELVPTKSMDRNRAKSWNSYMAEGRERKGSSHGVYDKDAIEVDINRLSEESPPNMQMRKEDTIPISPDVTPTSQSEQYKVNTESIPEEFTDLKLKDIEVETSSAKLTQEESQDEGHAILEQPDVHLVPTQTMENHKEVPTDISAPRAQRTQEGSQDEGHTILEHQDVHLVPTQTMEQEEEPTDISATTSVSSREVVIREITITKNGEKISETTEEHSEFTMTTIVLDDNQVVQTTTITQQKDESVERHLVPTPIGQKSEPPVEGLPQLEEQIPALLIDEIPLLEVNRDGQAAISSTAQENVVQDVVQPRVEEISTIQKNEEQFASPSSIDEKSEILQVETDSNNPERIAFAIELKPTEQIIEQVSTVTTATAQSKEQASPEQTNEQLSVPKTTTNENEEVKSTSKVKKRPRLSMEANAEDLNEKIRRSIHESDTRKRSIDESVTKRQTTDESVATRQSIDEIDTSLHFVQDSNTTQIIQDEEYKDWMIVSEQEINDLKEEPTVKAESAISLETVPEDHQLNHTIENTAEAVSPGVIEASIGTEVVSSQMNLTEQDTNISVDLTEDQYAQQLQAFQVLNKQIHEISDANEETTAHAESITHQDTFDNKSDRGSVALDEFADQLKTFTKINKVLERTISETPKPEESVSYSECNLISDDILTESSPLHAINLTKMENNVTEPAQYDEINVEIKTLIDENIEASVEQQVENAIPLDTLETQDEIQEEVPEKPLYIVSKDVCQVNVQTCSKVKEDLTGDSASPSISRGTTPTSTARITTPTPKAYSPITVRVKSPTSTNSQISVSTTDISQQNKPTVVRVSSPPTYKRSFSITTMKTDESDECTEDLDHTTISCRIKTPISIQNVEISQGPEIHDSKQIKSGASIDNTEAVTLEIQGNKLVEQGEYQRYRNPSDTPLSSPITVTLMSVEKKQPQQITFELRSSGPLI